MVICFSPTSLPPKPAPPLLCAHHPPPKTKSSHPWLLPSYVSSGKNGQILFIQLVEYLSHPYFLSISSSQAQASSSLTWTIKGLSHVVCWGQIPLSSFPPLTVVGDLIGFLSTVVAHPSFIGWGSNTGHNGVRGSMEPNPILLPRNSKSHGNNRLRANCHANYKV